ncbi:MAG: prephenate dehydrogenase/arogenate dehydrogenase family protein [Verrucomicrobia bacterium]|nr:prephenate dehydrogenase/arogenate dehydrogenase family protein [Verrucomicrobiota bacterium]
MKTVAILGLGLMGGSLGLALKAGRRDVTVRGYARRAETREEALRRGAVDEVYDEAGAAVEQADLAVFCVPILAIPPLVSHCRAHLAPGCLLTDVGSTKAYLVGQIGSRLQGTTAVFIGSHPIAGSEQQGIGAARAGLYQGAVVVVTPGPEAPPAAIRALRSFWEGVGGVVRVMDPEEHDQVMARTSHLPHLAAALLASAVGREDDPARWVELCGTGFRDTTRIAEGSPEVWHDIIRTNAGHAIEELRVFASEVTQLSNLIEEGQFDSMKTFLEKARARRRALVRERVGEDAQG